MSNSLQDKVEYFLSKAMYITFSMEDNIAVISFLYDSNGFDVFSQNENFKNLKQYLKGRKVKLVTVTKDANTETSLSLVDIQNGDTVNLKGPKFVNGNFHKFIAANLPENTIFNLTIMGKSRDNTTLLLPEELLKHKALKIHGYSLIDNRKG